MWFVIAVVSVLLAVVVLLWRVAVAGRPTTDDNDPERQHEVPGARGAPPERPQ